MMNGYITLLHFKIGAIVMGIKMMIIALSIDRIDPNKDYCPENCRWITKHENYANTSKTKYIESYGLKFNYSEWSILLGYDNRYIGKQIWKNGLENVQNEINEKTKKAIDESKGTFPILFFDNENRKKNVVKKKKIVTMYDRAKKLTVNGITKSCREWSTELGFHIEHFNRMINEKGTIFTINTIKKLLKENQSLNK